MFCNQKLIRKEGFKIDNKICLCLGHREVYTDLSCVLAEYYERIYDDIIIPDLLSEVHPKAAITKRNQWMAEKSDIVITYVYRNFGGAYAAKKYAAKLENVIIEINDILQREE